MKKAIKGGVAGALAGLLLLWCGPGAQNPASALAAPPQGFSWFTGYTAQTFRQLPAAAQRVDPATFNRTLLDAAVFHEVKRRRQSLGLPPLAFNSQARQMARLQAQAMAATGVVSHRHPNPARRTLADRARLVGLHPAFLAENVASTFGRRYRSGSPFYVRQEHGRTIYSLQPGGPAIPRHTYLSFAAALLNAWMASPGHRQNILSPQAQFLGCACEPSRAPTALETFYCTQVFFAPLKAGQ